MKKEIIIDFETLGVDATSCAVIDCSVVVFERERFINNPYTLADINNVQRFKLSVKDQVSNYNSVVESEVIEFWSKQESVVRNKIKPLDSDLTVTDFVNDFHEIVVANNIDYWWSRGNAFDPIILTRLYNSQNMHAQLNGYLKYHKVRDMRTYIDAKFDFSLKQNGFVPIKDESLWEKSFKLHDSSWDVLADLLRLQAITRAENDLELI